MTSKNKKLKRQKRRQQKKEQFYASLGSYNDVFSYDNLYNSFFKCKQGVMWKSSIQTYYAFLIRETEKIFNQLNNKIYKSRGFTEFDIMERGKLRHIRSVHISERCVQRTLCDKYLAPIVARNTIHDNGASMKDKGTHFALKRLDTHLLRYYKRYKSNQGYILLYDFSDYFNSIDHKILFDKLDKLIPDKDILKITHHFINCFGDEKSLGLGSQVSQLAAILFADEVDKMFKEECHQKYYGRYMDDGYCIVRTKEEANYLKMKLFVIANKLKLKINEKKIQIRKLSSNFVFLKKRYTLTKSGKLYKRLCRKSIRIMRRKLKKLAKKMEKDQISFDQFKASYISWRQNAIRYKNFLAVHNLDKLYGKLSFLQFKNEKFY